MEKLGVIGGMGAEAIVLLRPGGASYGCCLRSGTYRHGGVLQVDHARPHVGH